MSFDSIKKHPLTEQLLPRFSRRREIAARVWQISRTYLHFGKRLFSFARRHGIAAAFKHACWQLRSESNRTTLTQLNDSPPEELLLPLLCEVYPERLPSFSIVSILYNKEQEIPFFLQALFRQTYSGKCELILVNDASPDNGVSVARETYAKLCTEYPTANLTLQILENHENMGNCTSRNAGIALATGDILVVVDADCVLNSSFLARHALALGQGPFDACIGPCNIESGHGNPMRALTKFENEPEKVLSEQNPQDPLCPAGFVNCITRNFSILRSKAPVPLFDPDFTYSAAPDSGFGWEDVDMGYRIYNAGLRLAFIPEAFSLHISHQPNQGEDPRKAQKSLRNFSKLFRKHTDIALCAARWAHQTYAGIWEMEGDAIPTDSPDKKTVEDALNTAGYKPLPLIRAVKPRLRILTYHWHTTHQYELFKLPHDFYLVKGIGLPFTDTWDFERRPFPRNARFIRPDDVREQDFDLAIVPFDENVLSPGNSNGVLSPGWGDCFRWFLKNVSLPKIGICHGTPQFYGQYDPGYAKNDLLKTNEAERLRLVEATKNFLVVCNSYQAQREWGFHSSQVIWHGMDPQEFRPRPVDAQGVLSLNPNALKGRPFYNGYTVYQKIIQNLPENLHPKGISPARPLHCRENGNVYAQAKYCNYIDVLRSHLVYLNPTLRSPMPRTRTEAMLCGLIGISMRNHDVDMFIENEKNGFFGESAEELCAYIAFCHNNPAAAKHIGKASRLTAMKIFSLNRYHNEWEKILSGTL